MELRLRRWLPRPPMLIMLLLLPRLLRREEEASSASRFEVRTDCRRALLLLRRMDTGCFGILFLSRLAAAASRFLHPGDISDDVDMGDDDEVSVPVVVVLAEGEGVPTMPSRRSTRALSASTTTASWATVRGLPLLLLLRGRRAVAAAMRDDRRRERGVLRFMGVPCSPRRTRHRPVPSGPRHWFEWGQALLGSLTGAPPKRSAPAAAAAAASSLLSPPIDH